MFLCSQEQRRFCFSIHSLLYLCNAFYLLQDTREHVQCSVSLYFRILRSDSCTGGDCTLSALGDDDVYSTPPVHHETPAQMFYQNKNILSQ